MDRRVFMQQCLGAAACTGGAFALTSCASLTARPVTPVNGRIQLALNHYPELTETGGSVRLQPAGMRDPIYVLTQADGRFAALSPIPHASRLHGRDRTRPAGLPVSRVHL